MNENIFDRFLSAEPHVEYHPDYNPHSNPSADKNEWSNIMALTYDSATINGQKTKVFAYIGFPDGASQLNKVPAVVLVHGGTGHPYAEWIKLWNDRGYAAIAMDNTGYFPSEKGKGIAGRELEGQGLWHYGLYGDFLQDGYVNAPDNDKVQTAAEPLEKQWLYHAIADTIIAHKILANDERVDSKKIGISGISWGGVITSLAIGYDTDYAFAISIYGSAYLDEGHGWMGPIFSEQNAKRLWSAADRLHNVKFPICWLCWAEDAPFSLNSNSKSYIATMKSGSVLNTKVNWGHCHSWGWNVPDSYIFADAAIGRRQSITTIKKEPLLQKVADGSYKIVLDVLPDIDTVSLKAEAHYITADLSYSRKGAGEQATIDQIWQTKDCSVSDNKNVTAFLPKEAVEFFVSIKTETNKDIYQISSGLINLKNNKI